MQLNQLQFMLYFSLISLYSELTQCHIIIFRLDYQNQSQLLPYQLHMKVKIGSFRSKQSFGNAIDEDYVPFINTQFSTNNVMKDYKSKTIFLPGYLRIKFKNFTSLDIGSLSAQLNASILLTVFYGDFIKDDAPKQKEQDEDPILNTLKNQIVMLFARDNAIRLTERDKSDKELDINIDHDCRKKQIKYSIKNNFHLLLESQIFWTPFEIIHAIMEITLQPLSVKLLEDKQYEKWKIKFNLMDFEGQKLQGKHKIRQDIMIINSKMSFANWGTFGNYDLAQKKMRGLYTNYRVSDAKHFFRDPDERIQYKKNELKKKTQEKYKIFQKNKINQMNKLQKQLNQAKNKKPENDKKKRKLEKLEEEIDKIAKKKFQEDQQKFQQFHYGYFNIPLYKFPFSSLATIFGPLALLAVLNLGIFFQNQPLGDRVAAVSALMLAFVALIPTIRSQIPPCPQVVFIQILVYIETITTLLALLHSLDIRNIVDFQLDPAISGFFIVSYALTILIFIWIIILMMIHYLIWQPSYNLTADRDNKMKFNRTRWTNTQCDRYYSQRFQFEKRDGQQFSRLSKIQAKQNS